VDLLLGVLMKLSIALTTESVKNNVPIPMKTTARNIRLVSELGYDGIELHVQAPQHTVVTNAVSLVKASGLKISALGTGLVFIKDGLSFTHPEHYIRIEACKRIQDYIDLAAQYNAVVIIGLIRGQAKQGLKTQQVDDWLFEALRLCANYAAEKNVNLALEPINCEETNLVNTVEQGLELIDKVASDKLGLLLDTYHMNIEESSGETSIEKSIYLARDRIFHFHVADANRHYPGAGNINFRRIFQTLNKVGYKHYISGEFFPLPTANISAKKAIEYMQSLIS
jgi:5-keto-L-gluconate epimerase